jgi:TRAP-type C4-dicarboxylate transport system permease small subunit|tara:strand:+ start:582 stop:1094 length:513 start_codon:yes stop_codon:yes gene_type:complete
MITSSLDRWSKKASLWLYNFGVYGSLPALFLLVTLEIILRYAFNAPLQWSRDANGLLLLMTLFSALPHAWDRGFHIRMEVIYTRFSPKWRSLADVLSALASFVFVFLLTIQAFLFSRYMFLTTETGEDLNMQLWPFMIFIALCGMIFSMRILINPFADSPDELDDPSPWI